MKKVLLIAFAGFSIFLACKKDKPTSQKGFKDITYAEIHQQESKLSSDPFTLAAADGNGPQVGAIIVYQTKSRVLGKLKVTKIDPETHQLTFDMVNYKQDGSEVLLEKNGVAITSTYYVDLDKGTQTQLDEEADFGWNQREQRMGCSLTVNNGAKFYVYATK